MKLLISIYYGNFMNIQSR